MKFISSGFGDGGDHPGSGGAVLRLVIGSQQADLADRLRRHRMVCIGLGHAADSFHAVLYGHTIEHSLIAQFHATINARIEARVARPGVDSRHQDGKLSCRAYRP